MKISLHVRVHIKIISWKFWILNLIILELFYREVSKSGEKKLANSLNCLNIRSKIWEQSVTIKKLVCCKVYWILKMWQILNSGHVLKVLHFTEKERTTWRALKTKLSLIKSFGRLSEKKCILEPTVLYRKFYICNL